MRNSTNSTTNSKTGSPSAPTSISVSGLGNGRGFCSRRRPQARMMMSSPLLATALRVTILCACWSTYVCASEVRQQQHQQRHQATPTASERADNGLSARSSPATGVVSMIVKSVNPITVGQDRSSNSRGKREASAKEQWQKKKIQKTKSRLRRQKFQLKELRRQNPKYGGSSSSSSSTKPKFGGFSSSSSSSLLKKPKLGFSSSSSSSSLKKKKPKFSSSSSSSSNGPKPILPSFPFPAPTAVFGPMPAPPVPPLPPIHHAGPVAAAPVATSNYGHAPAAPAYEPTPIPFPPIGVKPRRPYKTVTRKTHFYEKHKQRHQHRHKYSQEHSDSGSSSKESSAEVAAAGKEAEPATGEETVEIQSAEPASEDKAELDTAAAAVPEPRNSDSGEAKVPAGGYNSDSTSREAAPAAKAASSSSEEYHPPQPTYHEPREIYPPPNLHVSKAYFSSYSPDPHHAHGFHPQAAGYNTHFPPTYGHAARNTVILPLKIGRKKRNKNKRFGIKRQFPVKRGRYHGKRKPGKKARFLRQKPFKFHKAPFKPRFKIPFKPYPYHPLPPPPPPPPIPYFPPIHHNAIPYRPRYVPRRKPKSKKKQRRKRPRAKKPSVVIPEPAPAPATPEPPEEEPPAAVVEETVVEEPMEPPTQPQEHVAEEVVEVQEVVQQEPEPQVPQVQEPFIQTVQTHGGFYEVPPPSLADSNEGRYVSPLTIYRPQPNYYEPPKQHSGSKETSYLKPNEEDVTWTPVVSPPTYVRQDKTSSEERRQRYKPTPKYQSYTQDHSQKHERPQYHHESHHHQSSSNSRELEQSSFRPQSEAYDAYSKDYSINVKTPHFRSNLKAYKTYPGQSTGGQSPSSPSYADHQDHHHSHEYARYQEHAGQPEYHPSHQNVRRPPTEMRGQYGDYQEEIRYTKQPPVQPTQTHARYPPQGVVEVQATATNAHKTREFWPPWGRQVHEERDRPPRELLPTTGPSSPPNNKQEARAVNSEQDNSVAPEVPEPENEIPTQGSSADDAIQDEQEGDGDGGSAETAVDNAEQKPAEAKEEILMVIPSINFESAEPATEAPEESRTVKREKPPRTLAELLKSRAASLKKIRSERISISAATSTTTERANKETDATRRKFALATTSTTPRTEDSNGGAPPPPRDKREEIKRRIRMTYSGLMDAKKIQDS